MGSSKLNNHISHTGIASKIRSVITKFCLLCIGSYFLLFVNAASAQVIATGFHGTNCMAANLAQGQLLSWNRNGLTNNFGAPLFVICPLPLEHSAIPSGATTISAGVDWYLPPTYSASEGPLCILRVLLTGFGNPNVFFFNNIANNAFLGPLAPGGTGFSATNGMGFPIDFNNSFGSPIDH